VIQHTGKVELPTTIQISEFVLTLFSQKTHLCFRFDLRFIWQPHAF